jgi:hypothetical protein
VVTPSGARGFLIFLVFLRQKKGADLTTEKSDQFLNSRPRPTVSNAEKLLEKIFQICLFPEPIARNNSKTARPCPHFGEFGTVRDAPFRSLQ